MSHSDSSDSVVPKEDDQLAPINEDDDAWIIWFKHYQGPIDNAQIRNIDRQLRALSDDFGNDSQRMPLLFIRQMESIAEWLTVLFSFLICMDLIGMPQFVLMVLYLLVWILQSIDPVVLRAMDSLITSIVWALFHGLSVLATIFRRRSVLAIIIIIFGSIYIYFY